MKLLELKTIENKSKEIILTVNESIKKYMEENFIENINYFKKKNIIEFKSKAGKVLEKIEKITNLKKISEETSSNTEKKIIIFKKKKFYKKRFYKKKIK